jgi:Ca2+-binding RTX toxin-like protein
MLTRGVRVGRDLKLADSVILRGVEELGQLSATNFTFADGSRILIGNNKTGTASDDSTNKLIGTAHNDLLIGLGGNDILDGRNGSDNYVIYGNDDGTNRYRDSGTTGIDKIVAGSNGTVIGLGVDFSNLLPGIEAISPTPCRCKGR